MSLTQKRLASAPNFLIQTSRWVGFANVIAKLVTENRINLHLPYFFRYLL